MAPKDAQSPQDLWVWELVWQRDCADVIIVRACRWRCYLGLPRWAWYSHGGPYKGRREAEELETEKEIRELEQRVRERKVGGQGGEEDALLLALKMQKGTVNQGMQVASRSFHKLEKPRKQVPL